MAKIPYADLANPEIAPLVTRIAEARGSVLHLYQMLLHSPTVAEGWLGFLTAIRQKSVLGAALRELVIMRVASLNGARYEADQHAPFALSAGITLQQLEELGSWPQSEQFTEQQRVVLQLTDEMTRSVEIAPDLIERVRTFMSERECVELVATVAAYNMVSRFIVAMSIHSNDIVDSN